MVGHGVGAAANTPTPRSIVQQAPSGLTDEQYLQWTARRLDNAERLVAGLKVEAAQLIGVWLQQQRAQNARVALPAATHATATQRAAERRKVAWEANLRKLLERRERAAKARLAKKTKGRSE